MRFWLALVSMLLSLAVANAQCIEFPAANGRPSVRLCPDDTRPRECDFHGCYFDDLKKWRARQNDSDLQNDLQRLAEEVRRKLEADRKNPN